MTIETILVIALVGLVAGTLGGMLGVGGSVIMIPALAILFGQNERAGFNQHLYQAAAMVVNVFVALPAVKRHYAAGALVKRAVLWMLPATAIFVLIGVWTSNLAIFKAGNGASGPILLGRVMGVFLLYVIGLNIYRVFRPATEAQQPDGGQVTVPRASGVGAAMGYVAGLLGIGGGAVSVPLQQVVLKLPLRSCIANSSAVMVVTAAIGAAYKNATLTQHGLQWQTSLVVAAMLIPTAFVGGYTGAHLTHVLPLRWVRLLFIVLMIVAAWRMLAI